MPVWTGGPCPECGEEMPEKLIHCQICRALLNPELDRSSVLIPEFVPLPEIDAMVEVYPTGYFLPCPICDRELRMHQKYLGQKVACRFCDGTFDVNSAPRVVNSYDFYSACPHCNEEIRVAPKYRGAKVLCKFCEGKLHIDPHGAT